MSQKLRRLLFMLLAAQTGFAAGERPAKPAEIMPLAAHSIINSLAIAGDHLLAVGERGHILRSADGDAWHQVAVPARVMLTGLHFVDSQRGWATGYDGVALHTADGGANWALQQYDPQWGRPYYDVLFTDARQGWLVGANGRLRRSQDGGQSWVDVEDPVLAVGLNLYAIAQDADGQRLLVGERGFLARQRPGSTAWEQLKPPYVGSFFGVALRPQGGFVIYGLEGRVFQVDSLDGLPHFDDPWAYDPFTYRVPGDFNGWQPVKNPVEQSLYGASWQAGYLWLAGVDGSLLRLDTQAASLQVYHSGRADPIADIAWWQGRLLSVGRTGIAAVPMRPQE